MKCCRNENVEAPQPGCPCFHCYVASEPTQPIADDTIHFEDGVLVARVTEAAFAKPNGVVLADDLEKHDMVNHPKHYTSHPSGVECADIIEHFPHNVGAAIKYLWRHGLKNDTLQDLEKARWYVDREIQRVKKFNLLNRRPNGESTR